MQLNSEAMGVYEIQILETEHGTQGFYVEITPALRTVRVIIDHRWVRLGVPIKGDKPAKPPSI